MPHLDQVPRRVVPRRVDDARHREEPADDGGAPREEDEQRAAALLALAHAERRELEGELDGRRERGVGPELLEVLRGRVPII